MPKYKIEWPEKFSCEHCYVTPPFYPHAVLTDYDEYCLSCQVANDAVSAEHAATLYAEWERLFNKPLEHVKEVLRKLAIDLSTRK